MTCIVGLLDKKKDCVYVGADSLGSNGYTQQLYKNKKVFKACDNPSLVMAICGTYVLQNILSVEENIIDELTVLKDSLNFKYMVQKISPKIVELTKKYNCYLIKEQSIGGDVIFAYKNKLYIIQNDCSVLESQDDYVASGSGGSFALSVLSQNQEKDAVTRIIEALQAAERHGPGIHSPFYILNTKDNEEIVRGYS
jgi:ATP-dependent protease HslVU (ClpYQ) peptidase subunit